MSKITDEMIEGLKEAAAVTTGVRAGMDLRPSMRDWPEDFVHENGNYCCVCHSCQKTFFGHKRRITCKMCSKTDSDS